MNTKTMYNFGKMVCCAIGAALAVEAVGICGQALVADVTTIAGKFSNVVAKPAPVKPGLFSKVRR